MYITLMHLERKTNNSIFSVYHPPALIFFRLSSALGAATG